MGISGLLPFLKKASKKTHVRHFSGYTVAVDAYCWLHKGAFGCAQKLGTGEPTTAYVTYCLKYVNVLREHGLRPILVFDGRNLPSKAVTEKKRREGRQENRVKAREALRLGNKKEAWEYFTKCVDITPAMARELIKELRKLKLDYIIAPYEADAQLAYMARKGIVDMVVTEDSDLVLFGCPKVFFKMSVNGDGVFFDQSKIHLCMGQTPEQFQFEQFRHMCILSGCDYLPSIHGIGLGRAKKLITMSTNPDIAKIIKKIPSVLKIEVNVPEDYITEFQRAENTFLYQLVFDPLTRSLMPLTPYLPGIDSAELTYCGKYENKALALDMALGNVDFKTLERVDYFNPDDKKWAFNNEKSIWSRNYKIGPRLNDTAEMKKNTKHASTAGKHVIVSGVVLVKKRPLLSDKYLANMESESEDDILSMYTTAVKAEIKTEVEEVRTPTTNGLSSVEASARTTRLRSNKRIRLNNVYEMEKTGIPGTDESGNDAYEKASSNGVSSTPSTNGSSSVKSENETDVSHPNGHAELRKSNRARNPFLKTPQQQSSSNGSKKSLTRDQRSKTQPEPTIHPQPRYPVCLITKNKIYQADPNITVTVRSKYFRSGAPTFLGGGLRNGSATSEKNLN